MRLGAAGPAADECSRAGCREAAVSAVHWRNPRLHDLSRVKTWTACAEHEGYLVEFLRARDFPVVVTPVGETVASVGGEPVPGQDAR